MSSLDFVSCDTLVHVWGLPPLVPDLTSNTPSTDIDPTTWPWSSRLVEPLKCWLAQARISFTVKDSVTKVCTGNGETSVSGLCGQSWACVCRDCNGIVLGNPEGVIREVTMYFHSCKCLSSKRVWCYEERCAHVSPATGARSCPIQPMPNAGQAKPLPAATWFNCCIRQQPTNRTCRKINFMLEATSVKLNASLVWLQSNFRKFSIWLIDAIYSRTTCN